MSEVFKLSGIDWLKLAKGAGIAIAGTILTYLTEWLTGQDFGQATPLVVSAWAVAANFARKFLTNTGV